MAQYLKTKIGLEMKCDYCKRPFVAEQRNVIYCSDECFQRARALLLVS
jgi:hypothetical protein